MTQTMPDLPGHRPAGGLTRGQKAAVVVRLLMMGDADPGLSSLPRDQQRRLVREMASLRFVDRATLAETVAEFSAELDAIGLHFPRDVDRILQSLDGALSQDVIEGLLAETGGSPAVLGDRAWDGVAGLDPDALSELAAGETDEVCAVLLSKLPPARAASLLADLPADRADAVASALARIEGVGPDAMARIGASLVQSSDVVAGRDRGGAERVADILNVTTSAVRRAVLDRLDAAEPDFAARVRQAVFSWENIPERLAPRDVPKVLRAAEDDVLIPALSDAEDPVAEHLLGAISSRLADQIREGAAERGEIGAEAVEAARSGFVAVVRRLVEEGEVDLMS